MKRIKKACDSCGYESYNCFPIDEVVLCNLSIIPILDLTFCMTCANLLAEDIEQVLTTFIQEAVVSRDWRRDHPNEKTT